jgi:hypothetical protein
MNRARQITRLTDKLERPLLSSGGCKALALLGKGRAYQVRGHWRSLGFRGCIREIALLSLLDKGLAERGETYPYAQIQITEAGRAANLVFAGISVALVRGRRHIQR